MMKTLLFLLIVPPIALGAVIALAIDYLIWGPLW